MGKLGAARIAVRSLFPKELTAAQLGRQTARDVAFTAFARRVAYLHSARAPTWRSYSYYDYDYDYDYVGEGMRAQQQSGVPHGADIPYTMGTAAGCGCLGAPATAQDLAAAQRASQRWFDFAGSGTPMPGEAEAWLRDGRRDARLFQFSETADKVRTDFMAPRLNAFIGALNLT